MRRCDVCDTVVPEATASPYSSVLCQRCWIEEQAYGPPAPTIWDKTLEDYEQTEEELYNDGYTDGIDD
jgi:phage FluMu protein Com